MVVIVENPHFGDKFGPTPLLKLSWSQPKTPTNGLLKKKLMIPLTSRRTTSPVFSTHILTPCYRRDPPLMQVDHPRSV